MDLDDLLDDVDITKLESKPVTGKATAVTAKTTSTKKDDLDNILNDAVDSVLAPTHKSVETDIDAGLKISVISPEIKPWLAASANVPKELREKWTKMAKIDTDTEIVSKFKLSHAYYSWDTPNSKVGTNRSLQELVKKAASKCGFDDAKTAKLLNVVNPVTDTQNGKELQQAFAIQLVQDFKRDIASDPNYSAERFPNLAAALAK